MTPVEEAIAMLKARGVRLTVVPGEYVVNWPKGTRATEYRTSDLADAVGHGLAMGQAPKELPPLGPMGTAKGLRRGRIYAHNRRIAARRRDRCLERREKPPEGKE